jgi:FkbM family methyltransferase
LKKDLESRPPLSFQLPQYAKANFPDITNRKEREHAGECDLVHLYFGRAKTGYYIEVGANEPKKSSQTWMLEQAGWTGLLIEPNPDLCDLLRKERPKSTVVQAACAGAADVGRAKFHIAKNNLHSSLSGSHADFNPDILRVIEVDVLTLDSIIQSNSSPRVDFLSIDVEGHQLSVLQGIDFKKHAPRLVMIEDHLTSYQTHLFMGKAGYKLAKRTGLNNWYIPAGEPFTLTSSGEKFSLFMKLWVRTPARALRAWMRKKFGAAH